MLEALADDVAADANPAASDDAAADGVEYQNLFDALCGPEEGEEGDSEEGGESEPQTDDDDATTMVMGNWGESQELPSSNEGNAKSHEGADSNGSDAESNVDGASLKEDDLSSTCDSTESPWEKTGTRKYFKKLRKEGKPMPGGPIPPGFRPPPEEVPSSSSKGDLSRPEDILRTVPRFVDSDEELITPPKRAAAETAPSSSCKMARTVPTMHSAKAEINKVTEDP